MSQLQHSARSALIDQRLGSWANAAVAFIVGAMANAPSNPLNSLLLISANLLFKEETTFSRLNYGSARITARTTDP
jgi:hypothetical protein